MQVGSLGAIEQLEDRTDEQLLSESKHRAAARAILGARAAERYDAKSARAYFNEALVGCQPQERPPPGERGTTIGALTGLLFYVTSRSRTYTADELSTFVEAAGFNRVRQRRSQRFPGHVMITGRS